MLKQEVIRTAETILFAASNRKDGYCYPSDINSQGEVLDKALAKLKFYGEIFSSGEGVIPIFKINERGQKFADSGAWSQMKILNRKEKKSFLKGIEIILRRLLGLRISRYVNIVWTVIKIMSEFSVIIPFFVKCLKFLQNILMIVKL